MTELKNGLRAGDISVGGSQQFKDFDDYLMPKAECSIATRAKTGLGFQSRAPRVHISTSA